MRRVWLVVVLLAIMSPAPLLFVPVVCLTVLALIVIGLTSLTRFNRKLGFAMTGFVLASILSYTWLIYNAEQTHQALLAELSQYGDVTVRRTFLPVPYVTQLSIGHGPMDDGEVADILKRNELNGLTSLYLDNNHLTDECLVFVREIPNLNYVSIEGEKFSDEAILALESDLPNCTVIAYGRNLHERLDVFHGYYPDLE